MACSTYAFATAGSTNLQTVKSGNTANLKGICATNVAAYEVFVKLYWFVPTSSAIAPTVGTTVPNMIIAVPALGTTTGGLNVSWPDGINDNGQLWVAVTKLGTVADTTAVLANDAFIALLVE